MVGIKTFSWLLIAYQASVLYWWQIGFVGRMTATGILLLTVIPQFRFQMNKPIHSTLLVGFAVAFGFEGLSQLQSQGVYGLFKLLGEYLLLVQSLELIRAPRPTTANYVPGLSILAFAMLLMSAEDDVGVQQLNYLCTAFVILLALAMRPDLLSLLGDGQLEKRRVQLLTLILSTSIVSGWLFEKELNRNIPQLRQLLVSLNIGRDGLNNTVRQPRGLKLVDLAGLGSLNQQQRENSGELAFFVRASATPGYMRTIAFTSFDGKEWSNPWDNSPITRSMGFRRVPAKTLPPESIDVNDQLAAGMSMFELISSSGKDSRQKFVVEVPGGRGNLLPMAFDAAYVLGNPSGRSREILVDPHGSIARGSLANQSFVFLRGGSPAEQTSTDYLQSLLTVTNSESSFILGLANDICKNKETTSEKLLAVQEYFQNNFTYSLTAQPDQNLAGRSPLRAFLSERREAHCEYFATATALMLRSQGIPCRLSVGYLVFEKSDETGDFVAINKNAHAWVEAYDQKSGTWSIVESTPTIPDYIASQLRADLSSEAAESSAGGELIDNQFSLYAMMTEVVSGLYLIWTALLTSRFAWVLPGGLVVVYVAYRYALSGRRGPKQHVNKTAIIRKADRLASRFGLERQAGETCLQFADRIVKDRPEIVALAIWYQQFSATRYCEDTQTPPRLPQIGNRASKRPI